MCILSTIGNPRPAAGLCLGTAGWTLPKASRDRFPEAPSQLQRYAGLLNCVEINSTFYRSHRSATYERWAAAVPPDFQFALKLPKTITHVRRFAGCEEDLERFLAESEALGGKRAVLLAQLPPSFAFDAALAARFFDALRARYDGLLACEPRHASWFEAPGDALLVAYRIARAAADPARVPPAAVPGGWDGFSYYRWHGAPRTYYSSYEDERIAEFAALVCERSGPRFCIFDNTALGAATQNALRFAQECASREAESGPDGAIRVFDAPGRKDRPSETADP